MFCLRCVYSKETSIMFHTYNYNITHENNIVKMIQYGECGRPGCYYPIIILTHKHLHVIIQHLPLYKKKKNDIIKYLMFKYTHPPVQCNCLEITDGNCQHTTKVRLWLTYTAMRFVRSLCRSSLISLPKSVSEMAGRLDWIFRPNISSAGDGKLFPMGVVRIHSMAI